MDANLIRIGGRGINLAHIVRWNINMQDEISSDGAGTESATGERHEVVWVEFVNGNTDTFTHEDAAVLRRLLEQRSLDQSTPPSVEMFD